MPSHPITSLVAIILCLAMVGCGSDYQAMTDSVNSDVFTSDPASTAEATGTTLVAAANESLPDVRHAALANRKIIYNTSIGLVVKSYPAFESKLPGLVSVHGGFVASNQTQRKFQNEQSGTWIVRIPVDQYSAFLDGVHSLGFAESRKENAQDVTEEFVDIEARIKNKKQLEARVISILDERSGKLVDVLEIERELSRVREEIERMEGRIRYLADRTSLATVTINCREQQEYQPATAPSLANRIKEAWSDSIGAMRFAGGNLLVASVALLPWAVLLTVFGWVAYRITRRYWQPGSAIRSAIQQT